MKLALHTCCAPCAIYPTQEAKSENLSVTGFFYNPNIHPSPEYIKRKKECEEYFKSENIEFISPEESVLDFFNATAEKEIPPQRCAACWEMRLRKTATFAKEKGFDAFTTTLLGSPYQDHGKLKDICEKLSKEYGIPFYYKDFRLGFRDAHKVARMRGIYCQNYCGCVFSVVEREEAKKTKLSKCTT